MLNKWIPRIGVIAAAGLAMVGSCPAQPAPSDSAPPRFAGPDFDGDGFVGTTDLMILAELMRSDDPEERAAADLNHDNLATELDMALLLDAMDQRPGTGVLDSYTCTLEAEGTKLRMIDDQTGFALVEPTATQLWLPTSESPNPCLVTPTITLVPQPDGCDLVFRFRNTTTEWSGLGKITVAGLRFDDSVTSHDFRFDGKPITLNADNSGIGISGWYYPGGTYSPLTVVEDGGVKVGVSLLYPIMTYKHQVRIRTKAQFPGGTTAWFTEFVMNAVHENKYNPAGDLAPGENRIYTVAVRAVKGARPWQQSIEPYRAYFQARQGAVRYERIPSPVQFSSLAVDGNHDIDNPYGFAGGYNLRPDLFGFRPWVDRIVTRSELGYERVMVSKPTGQFYINSQNNIPPLFTSHWTEGDTYGHAMADALTQFPRVPQTGMKLALWWGRSAQVMPDGWDTFAIEDLDPHNPEHVALAFRELDLARAAGARIIGLDAFRRMQVWDAVYWIQLMKQRAPGVRFITEPVCGDILHNRAPAFQVATRPASEATLRVETRHYLADLLNPGHEIWGFIRIDRLTDYLGHVPTLAEWTAEAERVAGLGYVPCVSEPIPVTPGMFAAESWLQAE